MPRILRITPHLFRPGNWPVAFDPVGGLQNQVWRITEGLDRAGVAQTVLTTYIPGSPRDVALLQNTRVKCVGVRLPAFLAGPLLCFTWFVGVVPELLRARRDHDLVHIHFNHSVWCRVIALIVRRIGMPLTISMNTALWGGFQDALRLKGTAFDLTHWIERRAFAAADMVVALTETAAKRVVAEMDLDSGRVTVIPDAVDAEAFEPPVDEMTLASFRALHGIPTGAPIVSYVGRISPEKGWPDLPLLAQRLAARGAFLLVCGDGPDRRKLEAALATISCPHAWAITGFLPPEAVRVALALSDAMVLPSRREAFGSVLIEAMAARVPCVAYGVGGIPDVAGAPPAIALAAPGQRDALVHLVLDLLADRRARQILVERGARRVRNFSVNAAVESSLRLYRVILFGKVDRTRPAAETPIFEEAPGSRDGG